MDKDWVDIVESQEEKALFRALADEKWDWRTIDALVRESGMSEKDVRRTLEKYKKFIKKSSIPDRNGNELYTLRSRYIKRKRELFIISSNMNIKDVVEVIKKTVLDEGKLIEIKGENVEAKGLIFLLSGTSELSGVKYKATKDGAIFLPIHRYKIGAGRHWAGKTG